MNWQFVFKIKFWIKIIILEGTSVRKMRQNMFSGHLRLRLYQNARLKLNALFRTQAQYQF